MTLAAIPIIVLPLIASGRAVRQRSRSAQDTLAQASAYAGENLRPCARCRRTARRRRRRRDSRGAVVAAYDAAQAATLLRAFVTAGAILVVFTSVVGVLWLGAQDVLADDDIGHCPSSSSMRCLAQARSASSPTWSELSAAAGPPAASPKFLPSNRASWPRRGELRRPRAGRGASPSIMCASPMRRRRRSRRCGISRSSSRPASASRWSGRPARANRQPLRCSFASTTSNSGSITLDRVDLRDLDPVALRRAIALAPQDPVIFEALRR